MISLRECQERFAAELLAAGSVNPRIEIYRRNVAANYRNALAASYPVVRRLVGGTFFDGAVDDFTFAHPSSGGDLNEYGREFADFLRRFAPAAPLPYLADVASLEWAVDEAARAADSSASPRDVALALHELTPEALANVSLMLHPSARLLAARYGAMRIWEIHQPGFEGKFQADMEPSPECLLVLRAQGRVAVERLGDAEHAWLGALTAGAAFERALHIALAFDPAFDLGEALTRRIADGTLSGVHA